MHGNYLSIGEVLSNWAKVQQHSSARGRLRSVERGETGKEPPNMKDGGKFSKIKQEIKSINANSH